MCICLVFIITANKTVQAIPAMMTDAAIFFCLVHVVFLFSAVEIFFTLLLFLAIIFSEFHKIIKSGQRTVQ